MSNANPPPIPVDLEQVEAIRAMVEKSLPRAVITSLERAGVALLLGMSRRAEFQPVMVDPLLLTNSQKKSWSRRWSPTAKT
jgi:hypothetical protein